MKRYLPIVSIVLIIALFLMLTACGKQEAVLIYSDESISVTRSGRYTSVFDAQENRTYIFTARRVRRKKNAAETGKNAVETKSVIIYPVGRQLVIVEKDSGEYIYFRVR